MVMIMARIIFRIMFRIMVRVSQCYGYARVLTSVFPVPHRAYLLGSLFLYL